jgi:hypothetical protein
MKNRKRCGDKTQQNTTNAKKKKANAMFIEFSKKDFLKLGMFELENAAYQRKKGEMN